MTEEILIRYGEVIVVTIILMYYGLLGGICLGLARYVRRRAAREYDQDALLVRGVLTDLLGCDVQLGRCGVECRFKLRQPTAGWDHFKPGFPRPGFVKPGLTRI